MTGSETLVLSGGLINHRFFELVVDQARITSGNDAPTILIDQSAKTTATDFNKSLDIPGLFTRHGAVAYSLQDTFDRFPTKTQAAEYVANADALYTGGGSTRRVLQQWHKLDIFDMIADKVTTGSMVASGASAGALVWFEHGFSDSEKYLVRGQENWKYVRLAGLGVLRARANVHHETTDNLGRSRRAAFEKQLRYESNWRRAIAFDTRAALVCSEKIARVHALDSYDNAIHRYAAGTKDLGYRLGDGDVINNL